MGVMTKRQRGIIEDIESKLGYIFDGNDSPTGAHRFIEKHIDELRVFNKKSNYIYKPSGRQLRYIKLIEKELDITFDGSTLKDAWEWLQENIPLFKLQRKGIYG